MSQKIFVVDDSLTIQKVIKITLSELPYEIIECRTMENFEPLVQESNPDLVVLDYSFSESKTCYEMAEFIKDINSDTKIMLMISNLDNFDEYAFRNSSIDEKIVKPFESDAFIKKCKQLLDLQEIEIEEEVEIELADLPVIEENTDEEEWDIPVPSKFGLEDEATIQPERIDLNESSIEDINFGSETEAEPELATDDEEEDFPLPELGSYQDDTFSFSLDETKLEESENTEEDSASEYFLEEPEPIEGDISFDETSSPEDFWSVDETSDNKITESRISDEDDDLWSDSDEVVEEPKNNNVVDVDEIVLKLREQLEPMVREIIQQVVAEESKGVISKVAEDVITREIKELSKDL